MAQHIHIHVRRPAQDADTSAIKSYEEWTRAVKKAYPDAHFDMSSSGRQSVTAFLSWKVVGQWDGRSGKVFGQKPAAKDAMASSLAGGQGRGRDVGGNIPGGLRMDADPATAEEAKQEYKRLKTMVEIVKKDSTGPLRLSSLLEQMRRIQFKWGAMIALDGGCGCARCKGAA